MKNRTKLLGELRREIARLESERYRQEQQVWAESVQLRKLCKRLDDCAGDDESSIRDFCRVVSDYAATDSRISRLTEQLYGTL